MNSTPLAKTSRLQGENITSLKGLSRSAQKRKAAVDQLKLPIQALIKDRCTTQEAAAELGCDTSTLSRARQSYRRGIGANHRKVAVRIDGSGPRGSHLWAIYLVTGDYEFGASLLAS